MKIAIATCTTIPEVDHDEEITLEAFRRRGHEVKMEPWEAPSRDLSEYDGVIVRSTWNYPDVVEDFATWIRETGNKTRLLNPPDIMLGNLNKRYLADMEARGVPVVPSVWIWPSEAGRLAEMLTEKSVIKPTIGVGSMDTRVFEPADIESAIAWLGSQNPEREFMIQPFVASVETVGEQSIIMIGGEPSHRIHKHPRYADGEENVEGPFEVSAEFAELAKRIVEPVRDRVLYARVDLMMDADGKWVLSELEMIEPSLFFRQKPDALDVFVRRAEALLS
ncbi:MAG: hypothetical protein GC165_04605 [Armatimonadetes bacterium]|nr:hypothetical protein [Armatimonadota bacterium]